MDTTEERRIAGELKKPWNFAAWMTVAGHHKTAIEHAMDGYPLALAVVEAAEAVEWDEVAVSGPYPPGKRRLEAALDAWHTGAGS